MTLILNARVVTVIYYATITKTDNRREEQLMELMKQYNPEVLQDAFEAELNLERQKNTWLGTQLRLTTEKLHFLATNVNNNSRIFQINNRQSRKVPHFMKNTKSAMSRSGKARSKKAHTIHAILKEANNVCAS